MKGPRRTSFDSALRKSSIGGQEGPSRNRITIARNRQNQRRQRQIRGWYIFFGREPDQGLRDRSRKPHLGLGGGGPPAFFLMTHDVHDDRKSITYLAKMPWMFVNQLSSEDGRIHIPLLSSLREDSDREVRGLIIHIISPTRLRVL